MTNEKVIMAYIDKVAERTATEVLKKLAQNTSPRMNDEWIDSKEAARIAGVTPIYLRSIKHQFTYRKVGGKVKGRVLFNRREITDYFLNNN